MKEADIELLSPVTLNQQFLCQGANYRQHMIESGMDPDAKTFNMVFTKAQSCIAPANTDVVRPARVRFLDYEIELGLVLKRDVAAAQQVTDANLHEFVAGAVIVNDYSARDVQIPEMQFYKGKSFRTFGPVGPYLCLLEPGDFGKLRALQLTLTVNGKVRQKDSVANLVFGPAETLTELSGVQDLHVGDLLSTGTPAGCALSVPSPGTTADRRADAGSGEVEDVHEDSGRPGAVSEGAETSSNPASPRPTARSISACSATGSSTQLRSSKRSEWTRFGPSLRLETMVLQAASPAFSPALAMAGSTAPGLGAASP